MFEYQQHRHAFAKCSSGLERLLADELVALGAERVRAVRLGVHAVLGPEALYRAVHRSRLASHILTPLLSFDCHSDRYLYATALKLPWEEVMGLQTTFVIDAHVSGSHITHARYAAQKLKDALCDRFREQTGERPSVDRENPDLRINLVILQNRAVISLDAGGGSLHRRGYRVQSGAAPVQETLAAAVAHVADWNADVPLLDPMCGTGTLLAEALLRAGGVASGWKRDKRQAPTACLPDFDADLWRRVMAEDAALRRDVPEGLVRGADTAADALRAARDNLRLVPGGSRVELSRSDVRELPGVQGGVVLINPPYGERLEDREQVVALYRDLGDWLKRECAGSRAYILCGHEDLQSALGLRSRVKLRLRNGPIPAPLIEAEIRA